MTEIELVLVDDWELRGNGAGDMRVMQFETLRRLLSIYEKHGLKASINAEVMQQLHHREWGEKFPELRALADEWDALLKDAYSRGHDVQLHVHSQWLGARFEEGRWVLTADWSLVRHRPEDARDMIRRSKRYLEDLIRQVDPGYRCVSFRSGQWCLAPSDHMLATLAEEGFSFDMSIVSGVAYENAKIQFDYRDCEEPFLPFYPDMKDARKLARGKSPIVCVPTFSFVPSPGRRLATTAARAIDLVRRGVGRGSRLPRPANATPLPERSASKPAPAENVWAEPRPSRWRALGEVFSPARLIADLSALTFPEMKDMLRSIREQALRSGWERVPVILENHTKDLGDFSPVEQFALFLSRSDFRVITLRDLHRGLEQGRYAPVSKALA